MLELGDYVRSGKTTDPFYSPRIGRIHGIDDDGDLYIVWQNVNEAGNYWLTDKERCPIFDVVYLKLCKVFNKNV